jgi:DNA-directed RNA polymerase subunit M/transcription elongation factor TFIIS
VRGTRREARGEHHVAEALRVVVFSASDRLLLTRFILQLPRSNKTCPKCKTEDAVFFQSQQRSAETGMVCFFPDAKHAS